jgi:pilus assembly protein CpaC
MVFMNNRLAILALSFAVATNTTCLPWAFAAPPPVPGKSQSNTEFSSNAPVMLRSGIAINNSQVELTLGKAQIVHLNVPASRISISDPEVVNMVLISPTEVELIGKAVGVANLLVWSESTGKNYLTIDLSVHRDVSTLARKIQMIDPGINILPVAAEDSVILTGVAESREKAQLAYELAKAFFAGGEGSPGAASIAGSSQTTSYSPGSSSFAETSTQIINLVRVMGQPATKSEMVQERLKDIDPNIQLNVVPGFGGKEKAILTGRVRNASMVSKAVNLTSIFYGSPGIKMVTGPGGNVVKGEGDEGGGGGSSSGDSGGFSAGSSGGLIGNLAGNILHGSVITDTSGNVVSMLDVEERPQIKLTIKFMEIRKNKGRLFDAITQLDSKIKASSYGGAFGNPSLQTLVDQVSGTQVAQIGIRYGSEMATLLNGLITDGKARILAEPTITSISGEPSSFLAGGEFPIPVLGANGSVSVVFKEFGIRLNVLPTVTDRGTIHMQVSPEVSSLDPTAGVNINGLVVPGLRARRSQTVLEMKNNDYFVLSGLYNEDMTQTYTKTPLLGQLPIIGNLFRSLAYQRAETEMIIVIHPEIQTHMNLSNIQPPEKVSVVPMPSPASSTYTLPVVTQPAAGSAAPLSPSKTNWVEKPVSVSPGTSIPPVTPPSPSVTDDLRKAIQENQPPHAILQETRAVQKVMIRQSKAIRRGKYTPVGLNSLPVEAIDSSAAMLTTPPPKASYLAEQQALLTRLIADLEASSPTVAFPATPADTSSPSASPLIKPLPTTVKPSTSTLSSGSAAPKNAKAPIISKRSQTKAAAKPPQQAMAQRHWKALQQQIAHLLSFSPF